MTRFVISLGVIVQLFLGSAAAAQNCARSSAAVRHQPTKQSWTKALSGVRRGMTLEALDKHVKRVLKSDSLDWRNTSIKKGSDWPVRYYVLDQDWGLFIVHDYDKILRFWIGGFEDLKGEVGASLLPLVRAIHRAPALFGCGGSKFELAALVRSVNTLQAAGFKRSLRALRAYDKLFLAPIGKQRYLRHFRFDHQRIILIGQLLFVHKAKEKQLPIPNLGLSAPRFKFLEGPNYLKKHELGDPDWPYFPLALTDDVPFLLVRGYTLTGLGTSPRVMLEFFEKNCKLREKPLKPSSTPWTALGKFLASPAAKRERELQSVKDMLRLQVLRALLPAADRLHRTKIRSLLVRRRLTDKDWKALRKWFIEHKTIWNPRTQSYQSRVQRKKR